MSKKETKKEENVAAKKVDFVFSKDNYKWLFIGMGIIVLGFILMSGTEDILDFRKITLAPIVVIAGFVTVTYAILKKPRD
jgi:hypothetical protein